MAILSRARYMKKMLNIVTDPHKKNSTYACADTYTSIHVYNIFTCTRTITHMRTCRTYYVYAYTHSHGTHAFGFQAATCPSRDKKKANKHMNLPRCVHIYMYVDIVCVHLDFRCAVTVTHLWVLRASCANCASDAGRCLRWLCRKHQCPC